MKLNRKGKPFSWSYTALLDFEGCPNRYAHARFYCDTPFVETEALKWGNRVHKAAEMALLNKKHSDPEAFAPVAPYVRAIKASGHPLYAEMEIALNRYLKPTSWFAKDAWLRAKLDVVVLKDDNAAVLFDFKTGAKIREDEDQLRICAAALLKVMDHLETFAGKYIWTAHKTTTGIKPLTSDDIKDVWAEFLPRVARMQEAWNNEKFPMRQTPLCGWCQVNSCPHWRKR